ncbi:unnamed protein product [Rangifer tarandus platyrhynchus]|uniref:Uncharacterized protein n=2 Tax=Rangifer tarandus platyrhynchus TaxID=3082113 RepID=A0ACB0E436_RANTA|nr:unnamed protein product [Rangifer tarandus platyrhynchus]CAI9695285.1 unnamed protein product [Rangifer tarandus platyrhynchus]
MIRENKGPAPQPRSNHLVLRASLPGDNSTPMPMHKTQNRQPCCCIRAAPASPAASCCSGIQERETGFSFSPPSLLPAGPGGYFSGSGARGILRTSSGKVEECASWIAAAATAVAGDKEAVATPAAPSCERQKGSQPREGHVGSPGCQLTDLFPSHEMISIRVCPQSEGSKDWRQPSAEQTPPPPPPAPPPPTPLLRR